MTRSPDHLRGTALATYTGIWEATSISATPLFGLYADLYDDASMFGLLALTATLLLVVWAVFEHRFGGAAVKA